MNDHLASHAGGYHRDVRRLRDSRAQEQRREAARQERAARLLLLSLLVLYAAAEVYALGGSW